MDTATSHILAKLDGIERSIGELRREILGAAKKTTLAEESKSRLSLLKLPPMGQMIVGGVVSWGMGRGIQEYLSRGGDPMALFEALAKLVL
jgi:hypothetical protein